MSDRREPPIAAKGVTSGSESLARTLEVFTGALAGGEPAEAHGCAARAARRGVDVERRVAGGGIDATLDDLTRQAARLIGERCAEMAAKGHQGSAESKVSLGSRGSRSCCSRKSGPGRSRASC